MFCFRLQIYLLYYSFALWVCFGRVGKWHLYSRCAYFPVFCIKRMWRLWSFTAHVPTLPEVSTLRPELRGARRSLDPGSDSGPIPSLVQRSCKQMLIELNHVSGFQYLGWSVGCIERNRNVGCGRSLPIHWRGGSRSRPTPALLASSWRIVGLGGRLAGRLTGLSAPWLWVQTCDLLWPADEADMMLCSSEPALRGLCVYSFSRTCLCSWGLVQMACHF